MEEMTRYLTQAVESGASDLFLVAGGPVSLKLDGHLRAIGNQKLLPPDTQRLLTEIYDAAGRDMDGFLQRGDDDFSFALPEIIEKLDSSDTAKPRLRNISKGRHSFLVFQKSRSRR